jgi:hypothetical protein
MIPLFLLLGIGLATYVFSPKAHAWADDHFRAMREALAHHQDADSHLAVVNTTADPSVAADHLIATNLSNQEAARFTAAMAATAKTPAQKADAVQSAAVVDARQDKIAKAIAALSAGQCGIHSYAGVTEAVKDKLLAKLHAEGKTVTGDNPWDIDMHKADVIVHAVWNPAANALKLVVTGKHPLAPCFMVWAEIDPIVSDLILKG